MVPSPRLILPVVALSLTACSGGEDRRVNVVFAENDARADRLMGHHIALATDTGLVAFDAKGQVSPAIAQRWVVADDGLSYIFRIDDLEWKAGESVAARQVVVMFAAAMGRAKTSGVGPELASIRAVIPRTEEVIEVQLHAPRPRLLDLLANPALTLKQDGRALGPMTAQKLGGGTLLSPVNRIAESEDMVRPALFVRALPTGQAVVAYRDSRVDMLAGLRYDALPLIRAAEIPESEQRIDPTLGHFGLIVQDKDGLLSNAFAREAVSMAIDRPRLIAAFAVDGWREMNSLSPRQLTARGNVPNYEWLRLNAQDRKRQAAAQLARVGDTDRDLTIHIPARGPGSDLLFAHLRVDLADVGVRLSRVDAAKGADLLMIDEVADFDDPIWYLSRLSCARVPVCSVDGDTLTRQARGALSPVQRQVASVEAEAAIMGRYGYIPIATPLRLSLVRPEVEGFETNLRGLHLLQYLRSGS